MLKLWEPVWYCGQDTQLGAVRTPPSSLLGLEGHQLENCRGLLSFLVSFFLGPADAYDLAFQHYVIAIACKPIRLWSLIFLPRSPLLRENKSGYIRVVIPPFFNLYLWWDGSHISSVGLYLFKDFFSERTSGSWTCSRHQCEDCKAKVTVAMAGV